MKIHTVFALSFLLACSSVVQAQDQLTTQAVKRLDRVQAALDQGAKASDAPGLQADLAWANKRLGAVYKQDEPHHQAAVKRLKELDAQVRALAGQGGPAPAGGKEIDLAKLKSLERDITNAYGNLKILNKSYMGDGSRVGPIRRDIAKFRERLGEFPKEDAQVQAVAKVLDEHEGLFQ
ncbi:MAG TPA: hypothetical protein PKA37_18665, partial [Planctomycetota bacterium]|nr:hypothetical protein [Planctomycetota bacterium]